MNSPLPLVRKLLFSLVTIQVIAKELDKKQKEKKTQFSVLVQAKCGSQYVAEEVLGRNKKRKHLKASSVTNPVPHDFR